MYGAVLGDVIGSFYEVHNVKSEDFELFPHGATFTDDSVLTVAVAESILRMDDQPPRNSYAAHMKAYYRRYPNAGFGSMFKEWALSEHLYVQKSFGNGAAMRISAIGWAFDQEKDILHQVKECCHYTHHHKEAIQHAQAVAIAVFLARSGAPKEEIKEVMMKYFKMKFTPLDHLRDNYKFDSRSSYSVPPAIEAFLESTDYESCIRKAISIGGDSDTIAAIAGGIAEAYYHEIPEHIKNRGRMLLDMGLKKVLDEFEAKYGK